MRTERPIIMPAAMVSRAEAEAVSSGAVKASPRAPPAQGVAPRLLLEPSDAVTGSCTRCFLHELQDELIHLLVTFLGTPTQGSLLLSATSRRLREAVVDERFWRQTFAGRFTGKLRMSSLWRYRTSDNPPLRPALVLLSSLSCCSACTTDQNYVPASVTSESSLSAATSDQKHASVCVDDARRKSRAFRTPGASNDLAFSKVLSPARHFGKEAQRLFLSAAGAIPNSSLPDLSVAGTSNEALHHMLTAALQKAGVPSGGQCWRGKYFFKHALERKFTQGQYDVQHIWFPDGFPSCSPRSPDETQATLSQQVIRGGKYQSVTFQPFLELTKAPVHRKRLHQHHPGHLCPYRHPLFLLRRGHGHDHSATREGACGLGVESCAVENVVTGAATVPPVCVVGMKFFGDGVGLVYAARAGGVGACCPDMGFKLRSFSLHSTSGHHSDQGQARERTEFFCQAPRDRLSADTGGACCGASDGNETSPTEKVPKRKGASMRFDTSDMLDVSAEVPESPVRDFTNERYDPLALCVTHTIDEALCSGGRDPPLVLAGFSDGIVGVWDYRHPRTLLQRLDVSSRKTRRPTAVKSLCMVKSGTAHGAEVLAGAEDGRLSLLNIERPDAGVVQHLRGHSGAIQAISVQPEIGLGFTASRDRYVHVYDLRAGEMPVASCGRHHDWAMCVQVREGSSVNTFDTADRVVYSWDVRRLLSSSKEAGKSTAKPVSERHHHRRLISGLRSDALRLVSCSVDGTVLLSSVEGSQPSLGHNKGKGMTQLDTQQCSDVTVLRRGEEREWLLGVDFAETKMATAAADGGIHLFHFLQLPTLPQCCVYN